MWPSGGFWSCHDLRVRPFSVVSLLLFCFETRPKDRNVRISFLSDEKMVWHTWTTLISSPVSWLSCSLTCLAGFGELLYAIFNVSNCLAVIVVRGRFDDDSNGQTFTIAFNSITPYGYCLVTILWQGWLKPKFLASILDPELPHHHTPGLNRQLDSTLTEF